MRSSHSDLQRCFGLRVLSKVSVAALQFKGCFLKFEKC